MSAQVFKETPYRVPVVACDSLDRAYAVFLHEMLTDIDHLVFRQTFSVERRSFRLHEIGATVITIVPLMSCGVPPTLDDIFSLLLPVIRTLLVLTHNLDDRPWTSHSAYLQRRDMHLLL